MKNDIIKNSNAFLLFEVVISIVIITAGILFIMRSYSSSKMAIERSIEIFRTSLLLESKMWEYEAQGAIEEGTDSGDFEGVEGYHWEFDAEPQEEGFEKPQFNVVRLSVFKEKERNSTEYSIWTYLKYKFL